jgi:hypothetical protein
MTTVSHNLAAERLIMVRHEFTYPEKQVAGFRSKRHASLGMYVVTIYGFPYMVYMPPKDLWLVCPPHEAHVMGRNAPAILPLNHWQRVHASVVFDVYRNGAAGWVKHRMLGNVHG